MMCYMILRKLEHAQHNKYIQIAEEATTKQQQLSNWGLKTICWHGKVMFFIFLEPNGIERRR